MSMKFPRQECWSGVPFTTPGDLPDPGNKSESLAPPVLPAGFFTPEPPGSPSHSTPGPVQGGECCFCGFSLSAQATAVSTSHIPEKEVNMLLWETSKKTKCALIFLNTILIERDVPVKCSNKTLLKTKISSLPEWPMGYSLSNSDLKD